VALIGGNLSVVLRSAAAGVTLKLGPGGSRRASRSRGGSVGTGVKAVTLTVTARDARGAATTLVARMKRFR
jgi:hypothetical protein